MTCVLKWDSKGVGVEMNRVKERVRIMCYSCKFFDTPLSKETGVCKRFPPQVCVLNPSVPRVGAYESEYPITKRTDWCGEWRERGK